METEEKSFCEVSTVKQDNSEFQEQETSLANISEAKLDSVQMSEQLYNSAGLSPIVEAGLKDYDSQIRQESKLINKVLGPSAGDIKGYGDAVAKRVAVAIYEMLNRQYGGKMGDMRSYILALEDERNRANMRYDELMGKVVGILGDEYKSLRTDSNAFMEKLTTLMGEDMKASKINYSELASKLADIDSLRDQVKELEGEKIQLTQNYEDRISMLEGARSEEKTKFEARITGLEQEKASLTDALLKSRTDYAGFKEAIANLADSAPGEGIGKAYGKELHSYVLKDSKVPDIVIEGVGKFIDFEKYLAVAVERGVKEVSQRIHEIVGKSP
jgi:hypothetical protein